MTSRSYLFVHLLTFPFWGLFYLLPIVLYKELNATPFQIATMVALKPLVALFSPYWSQLVHQKPHRLINNLLWANTLKFLPFLFIPFFQNPWFLIIAFANFMMLKRGVIPGWIELLRLNLPEKKQSKICASASMIDYLGTALLPIPFGLLLDSFPSIWRNLFPLFALMGLSANLFIRMFPPHVPTVAQSSLPNFFNSLAAPWKNCWAHLSTRKLFLKFQIGFFLGGAGLMVIHPILPHYFVDILNLSYTEMLTAMAAFKGIGFVISSPAWVRYFHRVKIFQLCAVVTVFAALFPLLLLAAKPFYALVFPAYLVYGIMQGGSELSWKLSGPTFSKGKESTAFTSVNVLMVGIRGMIFPYLGSFLFFITQQSIFNLLLGALLSLTASFLMISFGKKQDRSTFVTHHL